MQDFNDGMNAKLAFRMRKVHPEQFHTLVKMHLSFELDINTEDNDCCNEKFKLKKWSFLNFSKKPKSTLSLQQKHIDSASLTDEGVGQVKKLIEYLSDMENITQEGIFRRTGKLTRQQDLKHLLYQRTPIMNLRDGTFSVHDCASVLKSFLAELSEPLLTELHYPAYCQIAELCGSTTDDSKLLRSLQLLLLLLPYPNRVLMKHVMGLLNKTARYECKNKMNCDTLATLFTPHLLCPRKLSPEALHTNSQNLSCLIAFMIKKGMELFEVPEKLAMDIRAYWVDKERRLLSPQEEDESSTSISDSTGTVHTIFSFVDHKLAAQANSVQDTQAALAQLYAHIQGMPDSAKKRRLVKQFNKENGQGTPRQVKDCKTKSLGDSIKKHIFQKKVLKHMKLVVTKSNYQENTVSTTLDKSVMQLSKSDDKLDSNSSYNTSVGNFKMTQRTQLIDNVDTNLRFVRHCSEPRNMYSTRGSDTIRRLIRSSSNPAIPITEFGNYPTNPSFSMVENVLHDRLTSTPSNALYHKLTGSDEDKSMSPITQSATKMTKAMQETMMTPRCRKPVMIVSGSNICKLATIQTNNLNHLLHIPEECNRQIESPYYPENTMEEFEKENNYSTKFKEYLLSRSVLTASPVDLSFTSRTGDYEPSESDINILNEEAFSDSLVLCLNGNNLKSTTSHKIDSKVPTPQKRESETLEGYDTKKRARQGLQHKQLSESNLNCKTKDHIHQDTSF